MSPPNPKTNPESNTAPGIHGHSVPALHQPETNTTNLAFNLAAAAAKKLDCPLDEVSVGAAIDTLTNQIEELRNKVTFFETLFGYPSEYLMAFREDELKRYPNIIFVGQQKLEGKDLQKSFREKTGKMVSLEALAGKSLVEDVKECHYAFAIALPMDVKKHFDKRICGRCKHHARRIGANSEAEVRDADAKARREAEPKVGPINPVAVERRLFQDIVGPSKPRGSMPFNAQVAPGGAVSTPPRTLATNDNQGGGQEPKRKRVIVISSDTEESKKDKFKKVKKA